MGWKTLEFLGKLSSDNNNQTFGFKSTKCPPPINELANFENDMMQMVKNIQFRKINNNFQQILKKDIKKIKSNNKVFVPADKSRNIYKLENDEYSKLLKENVTKTYKKSNFNKVRNINNEAKQITRTLPIADRIEKLHETEAYITIKDHKDDFPNKVSCRLINPCKSSIGKISKVILDRINTAVRTNTNVNQWKDTSSVIDWFKNIPDKNSCYFMVFDIESFYPSISEKLFNDAIQYAKQTVEIPDHDMIIINHSRKSLLFHDNEPWVKREGNEDFDVTMGSNDGAEVSELVGLFMLNKLVNLFQDNSVGLYRDDGLGVVRELSGPETERLRKNVIKTFKECGLNITSKSKLKTVDYLDVTFDLQSNSYKPYRKPDNLPVYIHKDSNHPPSILRELPKTIAKRLSDLSSCENVFYNSIAVYKEALQNSGFTPDLIYTPKPISNNSNNEVKKKRKRKIIWFNPPFSKSVESNIGKTFLSLIKRHFPKTNKLKKIFNKNTVKISYSCMSNMSSILSSHNLNVIKPKNNNSYGCNWGVKESCPLQNQCLTRKVIYRADIENDKNPDTKFYFGLTATSFKERFRNHTRDFTHKQYIKSTELSKYIWDLKEAGITPIVKWSRKFTVIQKLIIANCVF